MSETIWDGPHIKTIKQYIGPYTHQGTLDVDTSQPDYWNEIDLGASADYIIVDDALLPPPSASGTSVNGGQAKMQYRNSNHGLSANHTIYGPYYINPADYVSERYNSENGATELVKNDYYWSHLSGGQGQSLSNAVMELYQLGLSSYANTHLLQDSIQNAIDEPIRPNKELDNNDFYYAFGKKKEDLPEDDLSANSANDHSRIGDGPKNIIKVGDFLRKTTITLPTYNGFVNESISTTIHYPSDSNVDYDIFYAIGVDNYLTNNMQTNVDFCGSSYKKIANHILTSLNQKLANSPGSLSTYKDFLETTEYYNSSNNSLNFDNALYWFNANTTSENRTWEKSNPYKFLKTFLGTGYEEDPNTASTDTIPYITLQPFAETAKYSSKYNYSSYAASQGFSEEWYQLNGGRYRRKTNNTVEELQSGSNDYYILSYTIRNLLSYNDYGNSHKNGLNLLLDQRTINNLNNHFGTSYVEGMTVGDLKLYEVIWLTHQGGSANGENYIIYRASSEQKHINPMDTFNIYTYPGLPLPTSRLETWNFSYQSIYTSSFYNGSDMQHPVGYNSYYAYCGGSGSNSTVMKETTQLSRGNLFYWPLTVREVFNRELKDEKGLFDENELFLQYPFFNNSKNIMRIMQQLTSDNWALCADTESGKILVYNKTNGFGTIPLDSTDWDMPLCFRYGVTVGNNQMHHLYPEFSVEQTLWMNDCYNRLI